MVSVAGFRFFTLSLAHVDERHRLSSHTHTGVIQYRLSSRFRRKWYRTTGYGKTVPRASSGAGSAPLLGARLALPLGAVYTCFASRAGSAEPARRFPRRTRVRGARGAMQRSDLDRPQGPENTNAAGRAVHGVAPTPAPNRSSAPAPPRRPSLRRHPISGAWCPPAAPALPPSRRPRWGASSS